jgi:ABC-type antimicrobial peptide transport system permease subunit
LVDDILESSHTDPPVLNGFAIASEVADEIQVQEQFTIDRSVDTVLSIVALMVIPVTVLLYLVSGLNQRRKEIALLRVLGMDSIAVSKCVLIETVILILHGMFLLFVGTPFFINNSLFVTVLTSDLALSSFPNPILPIIPLLPLIYLLLYLVLFTGLLGLIHSIRILKRNISSEKGSIWEESLLIREEL